MNCRLCNSGHCKKFFSDERRSYYYCHQVCGLIFVPAEGHVTVEEEKKRYNLHKNSPTHEGYLRFLNELVSVVVGQTPVSGRILDYGSGPDAVLTGLLRKRGYDCTAYDPLYAIGTDALSKKYDAVILCEVVEHFRDMKEEIANINKVLTADAVVMIRTQLYPSVEDFGGWWYKNDITHINFFGSSTINTLAHMLGREKARPVKIQKKINIYLL